MKHVSLVNDPLLEVCQVMSSKDEWPLSGHCVGIEDVECEHVSHRCQIYFRVFRIFEDAEA